MTSNYSDLWHTIICRLWYNISQSSYQLQKRRNRRQGLALGTARHHFCPLWLVIRFPFLSFFSSPPSCGCGRFRIATFSSPKLPLSAVDRSLAQRSNALRLWSKLLVANAATRANHLFARPHNCSSCLLIHPICVLWNRGYSTSPEPVRDNNSAQWEDT